MLNNLLNANEIKNAAGTGLPFERIQGPGNTRTTVFKLVAENPSLMHRLTISHTETGVGLKRRRRTLVRFDKMSISPVDNVTPITTTKYDVTDAPVGALEDTSEIAEVNANLLSFMATTGAGTTVLFNGTGSGSVAALNGSL